MISNFPMENPTSRALRARLFAYLEKEEDQNAPKGSAVP